MYNSGERYYSLNSYFRQTFGEKIYKISINGGMTCPNRDGTLGTGGCIFCSEGGSGDFASSPTLSIHQQIESGKTHLQNKKTGSKYIAYFQAFTNTYGPVQYLEQIFKEALSHPDIIGLSIGTRPDCLPPDVLDLLDRLNKQKPIFIELGLQTIHPKTAALIRRGYPLATFEEALSNLQQRKINTIIHLIIGLPYETNEMILESIQYLNKQPIQGIKLSLLHILKHTDLEKLYQKEQFPIYTLEEYTDIIITCIENLRKDIVIHRITGDGPKSLLIQPLFSLNKRQVLNTINTQLKKRNTYQGKNANTHKSN